jgi:two-component system, NarL family, sensor kinase
MRKAYLPFFLFLINVFHVVAQDQREVDSLLNRLKVVQSDTAKNRVLYELAYHYSGNDPQKALSYAQELKQSAEKIGDKTGIGNAYFAIGDIESDKGNNKEAIGYYEKSLEIRQKLGNKADVAATYHHIGNAHYYLSNNIEASKYWILALKCYEGLGMRNKMGMLYMNIGTIYNAQEKPEEALKMYHLSAQIFQEFGIKQHLGKYHTNVGAIYEQQGKFAEALKQYETALKIKIEIGNKRDMATTYEFLGSVLTKLNRYEEAMKNLMISLKICDEIKDDYTKTGVCNDIGNIYLKLNKPKQAAIYLNQGLKLAKETGNQYWTYTSYESLANLDSMTGNYKQGLAHFKLFFIIRDSAFNDGRFRQIAEQQIQYEYDKKEAVLKYEQQLTQAQLKQQKIVITALVIGLIALILAAALYYQRQKQKELKRQATIQAEFTQQLLENIEEERGRIAIDLHDSISHELLSLKRGLKPQNTEGVPEQIDKIIDDIRQISRNLHPVLLDKIGLKMSIETLCEQYAEHETLFISHDIDYPKPLPKPAELQVFRIIQEALNNTVKYANANASSIKMSENTEGGVFLEIKDNGKGFDVEKALDSGKSFGLHSIVQRSKAIGGTAVIQSSEGGTVIKIVISD